MVAIPSEQYMTPEEYLEWEKHQEYKYEYINGQVYAMTGGTLPHNDVAINLTTSLKNHLRGKGCKVQISDVKVSVAENGPFFYPDVMVSCDERDSKAVKYLQYPCIIAEVLSPSTESYDRGKKFQHYRHISTLKEYLLISCEMKLVELFRLNDRGIWELHTLSDGDDIQLNSINFTCSIDSQLPLVF